MKTDKHLNENIKKAMENLEVPITSDAWKAFEERLEGEVVNNDQLLDKVVCEKLENLEVPLEANGWTLMQQMIEAEETAEILESEATLDNVIYDKISNYQAPYRHHHWQLMAQRLEQEFSLRYKLYKYKVAEAALMMLLLLTIIRFLPLLETTQPKHSTNEAAPPTEFTPEIRTEKNQQPDTEPVTYEPSIPVAAAPSTPTGSSLKAAKEEASIQPASTETGSFFYIGSALDLLPAWSLNSISSLSNASLAEVAAEKKVFDIVQKAPAHEFASGLLAQKSSPVASRFAWEVPQVAHQLPGKKRDLRFSIFTNTDVNYVFTPPNKLSVFDTLVATDPDTTAASGYGGGVLVSWKKGRWEFQTGGVYSFKRYIPNTPIFLFQTVNYYIREDFHGIQLDILQVPVNLQYHFVDSGKWRVYGLGGISNHFVTSSVYQIKYRRIPAFTASMIPIPSSPDDNRSIRQEKEFPEGLFDGGSLRDNYYLTANLGLGAERFLSSKWSIFLQPNYQHYLMSEGIGVNKDKFYTFSIYLGTKFSLK